MRIARGLVTFGLLMALLLVGLRAARASPSAAVDAGPLDARTSPTPVAPAPLPAAGIARPAAGAARPAAGIARPAAGTALRAEPVYSPTVRALLDAVSAERLLGYVCKLQDDGAGAYCNEVGTRYSYATAKLDEAARYLYGQLSALGLQVTYDSFQHAVPMTNVVGELPGHGPGSDHVYILSAHYDSTSPQPYVSAPGADDNGSGCAAVLEAARVLSGHAFPRTLRFVFFSGEEQGLFGSAHYAEAAHARGDKIDGVINLDMIGYESVPPNDHIVELHTGQAPACIALGEALQQSMALYDLQLAPQLIIAGATTRSDHASFWDYGYPAVLGIEDFDDFSPYYHKTSDTLAHMTVPLMVEFTKAAVATLAELASAPVTPEQPLRLYLPVLRR